LFYHATKKKNLTDQSNATLENQTKNIGIQKEITDFYSNPELVRDGILNGGKPKQLSKSLTFIQLKKTLLLNFIHDQQV
jgi:hypothetical protein